VARLTSSTFSVIKCIFVYRYQTNFHILIYNLELLCIIHGSNAKHHFSTFEKKKECIKNQTQNTNLDTCVNCDVIPKGFQIETILNIGLVSTSFQKRWYFIPRRCSLELMYLCLSWDTHRLQQIEKDIVSLDSFLNHSISNADSWEAKELLQRSTRPSQIISTLHSKRNSFGAVFHRDTEVGRRCWHLNPVFPKRLSAQDFWSTKTNM
jgi:hypothetical protein